METLIKKYQKSVGCKRIKLAHIIRDLRKNKVLNGTFGAFLSDDEKRIFKGK